MKQPTESLKIARPLLKFELIQLGRRPDFVRAVACLCHADWIPVDDLPTIARWGKSYRKTILPQFLKLPYIDIAVRPYKKPYLTCSEQPQKKKDKEARRKICMLGMEDLVTLSTPYLSYKDLMTLPPRALTIWLALKCSGTVSVRNLVILVNDIEKHRFKNGLGYRGAVKHTLKALLQLKHYISIVTGEEKKKFTGFIFPPTKPDFWNWSPDFAYIFSKLTQPTPLINTYKLPLESLKSLKEIEERIRKDIGLKDNNYFYYSSSSSVDSALPHPQPQQSTVHSNFKVKTEINLGQESELPHIHPSNFGNPMERDIGFGIPGQEGMKNCCCNGRKKSKTAHNGGDEIQPNELRGEQLKTEEGEGNTNLTDHEGRLTNSFNEVKMSTNFKKNQRGRPRKWELPAGFSEQDLWYNGGKLNWWWLMKHEKYTRRNRENHEKFIQIWWEKTMKLDRRRCSQCKKPRKFSKEKIEGEGEGKAKLSYLCSSCREERRWYLWDLELAEVARRLKSRFRRWWLNYRKYKENNWRRRLKWFEEKMERMRIPMEAIEEDDFEKAFEMVKDRLWKMAKRYKVAQLGMIEICLTAIYWDWHVEERGDVERQKLKWHVGEQKGRRSWTRFVDMLGVVEGREWVYKYNLAEVNFYATWLTNSAPLLENLKFFIFHCSSALERHSIEFEDGTHISHRWFGKKIDQCVAEAWQWLYYAINDEKLPDVKRKSRDFLELLADDETRERFKKTRLYVLTDLGYEIPLNQWNRFKHTLHNLPSYYA